MRSSEDLQKLSDFLLVYNKNAELHVHGLLNLINKLHVIWQAQNPDCIVVVDNCYGEFVETAEPTAVVCAHSLLLQINYRSVYCIVYAFFVARALSALQTL